MMMATACGKEEKKETTISGDVEVDEDIEEKINRSEELAKATEQYDYKNLPVAEPVNPSAIIDSSPSFVSEYESAISKEDDGMIEVNTITSYYARQLPERSQLAYREVLAGALNRKENIAISKPINKSEFEKVMNIIFLDTPEAFMLRHKYEYTIDSTEKVSGVKLIYAISKSDQEFMYDEYVKNLVKASEKIKNSNNTADAIQSLYSQGKYKPYRGVEEKVSESLSESGFSSEAYDVFSNTYALTNPAKSLPQNYIASSKTFVAILRESGIDAAVKVGNLLNPEYYDNSRDIHVDTAKDLSEMIQEDIGNGIVKVTCDFSSLYSWVSVKINGNWYNVDPGFLDMDPLEFNSYSVRDIYDLGPMTFVDDYLISQSRTFYINDILLGESDPCTSRIFQPMYRSGKYVPVQNASKLTTLMDAIIEKVSRRDTEYIYYQFGSRENYSDFVKRFDERVTIFNRQYKSPIRSYKVYKDEELLLFCVYDVVKKDTRQK